MTLKSAYFVKIEISRTGEFEEFLTKHGIPFSHLSTDMSNGQYLYNITMDGEDAISLKLIFPLKGCMNFARVLGKETTHELD